MEITSIQVVVRVIYRKLIGVAVRLMEETVDKLWKNHSSNSMLVHQLQAAEIDYMSSMNCCLEETINSNSQLEHLSNKLKEVL